MRHIASEIFTDEFFGSLPMELRVLWIGLLASLADDQGRFMDNAALIRSRIFPYDEKITNAVIEKGLKLFHDKHKIVRYTHGTNGSGKRLVQIVNWWKYQKGAQWANFSQHPAPPKWMDRVRIHVKGNGSVPYLLNWDYAGGYVEPTKAQARRYTNTNVNTNTNTTTLPSSRKQEKKNKSGGGGGKIKSLSANELKRANKVASLLLAIGLHKPKYDDVLCYLAQSDIKDNDLLNHICSITAAVYADKDVEKKAVVIAHRLMNGWVEPKYQKPSTWKVIPADIFRKAGLDVPSDEKPQRMMYVDGQPKMVPA